MDKPNGCWIIALTEECSTSLIQFTGTADFNKATKMMKSKYGKYGKYVEELGDIILGDPEDDHYYSLIWLPIDLNIALWVDIDRNQFEVGANIPGLKCKMYYLDDEHSKIKRSKVFKLDNNAIAEMTGLIKENIDDKKDHCNP